MVSSEEKPMSATTASIASAHHLRLTHRGRAVMLVVFVAVLFGALSAWNARSAALPSDADSAPVHMVVAEPGETLWDIAVAVRPGADPRATIEEIIDLNRLSGPVGLDAGERLAVPTG
jgi:hypothetical protein